MVGKNQCKLLMIMLLKVVLDRNYTTIQAIQPLSKLKSCIISFILHKNFFFCNHNLLDINQIVYFLTTSVFSRHNASQKYFETYRSTLFSTYLKTHQHFFGLVTFQKLHDWLIINIASKLLKQGMVLMRRRRRRRRKLSLQKMFGFPYAKSPQV